MKFDITQQSAFASLVTLFVISVVGIFVLAGIDPAAASSVACDSLLGGFVLNFQHSAPVWSAIISSILIFYSTIWLGYVVSLQNLYNSNTTIQLQLICITLWSVAIGGEYLLSALVSALSVQTLGSLLRSVHSNNYSGYIFNASLSISLLVALYPSAAVLIIFMPLFWVMARITLRELIVSIVGLLLPLLWVIYLYWLCGYKFIATIQDSFSMLLAPSTLFELEMLPLPQAVIVALLLALTLVSILWIPDNIHRTMTRLWLSVLFLAVASLSLLSPSVTLLSLSLAAPALAIMASFALANLRGTAANILYFLLLISLVLAMFLPLYLRLSPLELLLR